MTTTAAAWRRVLAIDPGSTASGWARIDGATGAVLDHNKEPNPDLLSGLRDHASTSCDLVVIEFMSPRGMPTSAQEFETLWWAGRFTEAASPVPVVRVSRDSVKRQLLGKVNVPKADAVIRAVLIDRYAAIAGDPIGGKAAAVGLKAKPGPLYGVAADAWAALALACAYIDGAETVEQYRERKAREAA